MFHLFKTVYLEFDYKFNSLGYNFIMASRSVNQGLPMGLPESNYELIKSTSTFQELLDNNFEGDVEKFWENLYNQPNKTIVYLTKDDFFKLQVQFLKSVLVNCSIEDLYLIYKSFIESNRLRSYISTTAKDFRNYYTRNILTIPTFEEFYDFYDTIPVSNYLKNNVDRKTLSFEYLLGDYFYRGDASPYKEELLKRIEIITWDNWADELEHLRLEAIFGFLDMELLEDGLTLEVGEIESTIKSNPKLSWIFDENFDASPEYIRENYDYTDFDDLFVKVYSAWNGEEDMSELNHLIMNEQYEELLQRDIDRGFGCIYTFELFREKSNQVLATYLYRKKRKGETSHLRSFKLS